MCRSPVPSHAPVDVLTPYSSRRRKPECAIQQLLARNLSPNLFAGKLVKQLGGGDGRGGCGEGGGPQRAAAAGAGREGSSAGGRWARAGGRSAAIRRESAQDRTAVSGRAERTWPAPRETLAGGLASGARGKVSRPARRAALRRGSVAAGSGSRTPDHRQ